ncbi:MAG: glucose-1-phosphate thymidylyltransferase [Candidatus Omnitrophica bacterium CG1_02_44_16]|nr:MAG: glucose-1-phosphate thymidylyltransferase [Candidatus Omnitrophica bacterium CG1_02_44_16]PIY83008.1 MAG: glucose-1-phosphate thymidylyltransferase [Candidatus Omnitrophica bacterium CG_4_10_14_0_8_um_filter_44_12]PIZ84321.1 MAG: glucose-1-phosphate thymidylyltransferase [Candidatus Omnitrophica bacterium CG_4_10_14_0_2_um_filter_44_9]
MKGIILAGGKATRLFPITKGVCKQLLPIYDKPMIYYPLSVLMLAGIKDILLISTSKDVPRFKDLLGNGDGLGIKLSYAVQQEPRGLADSLIIGEDFIGDNSVSLILGDNIFYGHDMTGILKQAARLKQGAYVFGYYVKDPQRYGVIEFGKNSKVASIVEKPSSPKSNWAVTGLYFYDKNAAKIAKKVKPSARGEIEITSVNSEYLKRGELKVKLLGRGYAWLDTGTYDSLIDASVFIKTIEERQGLKVGCIEEVAYRMGYINAGQLERLSAAIKTPYGEYLKGILDYEKR